MDAEHKFQPECGVLGYPDGRPTFCRREKGHHPDFHSAPVGGEDVTWHSEPRFSGLLGPWGVACTSEQQQEEQARLALGLARVTAEDLRSRRYEAVELAIRALRPVAGAYDLPGLGPQEQRADYAAAIIELADRLGAYIQNGS